MNSKLLIAIVSVVPLLSGCISMGGGEAAPVIEASSGSIAPSTSTAPSASDEVQIRAYEPTAPIRAYEPTTPIRAYEPTTPVAVPGPVHGKAVVSLLKQSNRQAQAGDRNRAVATLERALRIEPRSAHLWNRLAHLRLGQKNSLLAAEMAAKSTALAGSDASLKRDNWLLIAQARRATGDIQGAKLAERRAAALY